MIHVDTSELDALAADLVASGQSIGQRVRPVVQRGALNVKNDWRERATRSAGAHGRLYPLSIGYESREDPTGAFAEIGPDSGRPQGRMGRGFEYGSINQPAHMDFLAAAEAESPRFAKALADLLGGIL